MEEKQLYYIWLSNTFRAGSPVPKLLLTHFKSIEEIYNAEKSDYEALSLSAGDILKLSNKDLSQARNYLKFCKDNNIGLLCFDEPYYPERLKLIDNPPALFYYKGRLKGLDDFPCITMVGTRSCSERGFRLAYETAYDASSKGAVIVNGLALGIDGACIAGALDANGYAVGILGCGIDKIYPSGNQTLFDRLSASGLILTEFSPFTPPEGRNFPIRNRVLSGLSIATCVFEADASKSGAMITAEHAVNQGRRIFAVPGKPYDKSYSGPLELIKNGATVFTEADDILTEYSMSFPHRINIENRNSPSQDKLDKLVAQYFKKGADPDEPVNRRYVPAQKTASALSETTPAGITVEGKNNKHTEVPTAKKELKTVNAPSFSVTDGQSNAMPQTQGYGMSHDLSTLSVEERKVYDTILNAGTATADEISACGIKIEQVLSILTLLEIYGHIQSLPGGRYKSCHQNG